MALPIVAALHIYPTLTPPEQAEIRARIFGEISQVGQEVSESLARADALYKQRFVALEAFIVANQASFSQAELDGALAARLRIRRLFSTVADGMPGITCAPATNGA